MGVEKPKKQDTFSMASKANTSSLDSQGWQNMETRSAASTNPKSTQRPSYERVSVGASSTPHRDVFEAEADMLTQEEKRLIFNVLQDIAKTLRAVQGAGDRFDAIEDKLRLAIQATGLASVESKATKKEVGDAAQAPKLQTSTVSAPQAVEADKKPVKANNSSEAGEEHLRVLYEVETKLQHLMTQYGTRMPIELKEALTDLTDGVKQSIQLVNKQKAQLTRQEQMKQGVTQNRTHMASQQSHNGASSAASTGENSSIFRSDYDEEDVEDVEDVTPISQGGRIC